MGSAAEIEPAIVSVLFNIMCIVVMRVCMCVYVCVRMCIMYDTLATAVN